MPSPERVSYDSSMCAMIFHFLPSKVHDAAAASFGCMLTGRLDLLPFNQPNEQYELRGSASMSFGPYSSYCSSYIYHAAFRLPNGLKEPDMNIFPMTRLDEDPTTNVSFRSWVFRTLEWPASRCEAVACIQVLLVILIGIEKSNQTGTLPTVTVDHWVTTRSHPNGTEVYSEIWMYGNNQDYSIPLNYIFETVPPPFVTNGIAHDLVIPGALVDKFMNSIRHAWVAMLWLGEGKNVCPRLWLNCSIDLSTLEIFVSLIAMSEGIQLEADIYN